MRRLTGLVILLAFLAPQSACAALFDPGALEAYVTDDHTDAGYVTLYEGSPFSEWSYQSDFDEYDYEAAFDGGAQLSLRLDFALGGWGNIGVPMLMAQGVCSAPLELAGLRFCTGGGTYEMCFEPNDSRISQWEEYDGEYEFSLVCYLGGGGLAFWRELRQAKGAFQLTLTRQDGGCAQIAQSPMPLWDERQPAQGTALDLFLDGLACAGYTQDDGSPTQQTLELLRAIEQGGAMEGLRVSVSPEEALAV